MWLSQALNENKPVVFISLGSEVKWQPWYVKAIYEGCLALNEQIPIKVCWAMNSDICKINEGYDEELFWVDKWVPQIEILAHPATKVGITHCGLGGIFEFIHTGVVPLCFPHFGDQGVNAENMIARGAGLTLVPTSEGNKFPDNEKAYYFE